jgi:hypothetical protein
LVPRGAVSEQEAEVDHEGPGGQGGVDDRRRQGDGDRTRAEIQDTVLVSPIRARVETRLAEPGRGDQLLAVINLYKALGGGWKLTDAQWTQPH